MAEKLYSGRIDAEPLCPAAAKPCTYCDSLQACTHRDGEHERTISTATPVWWNENASPQGEAFLHKGDTPCQNKLQDTPTPGAGGCHQHGRQLLVSAAAGSQETRAGRARVVGLITDPEHPADADCC